MTCFIDKLPKLAAASGQNSHQTNTKVLGSNPWGEGA